MLAQLKLAWWRDRLSADPEGWPKGEPLLARLATWGGSARGLVALVDGWEALLGEQPLPAADLSTFAAGRADAMAALAARLGADRDPVQAASRRWALADLALHRGDSQERMEAVRILDAETTAGRIGPAMRPLAVLAGLSTRAIRNDAREALYGPGALLWAIRLGLAGR